MRENIIVYKNRRNTQSIHRFLIPLHVLLKQIFHQQHFLRRHRSIAMASTYSPLTTHVLNTATGKPAYNMPITLHRQKSDSSWEVLKQGKTNEDGRLTGLSTKEEFSAGMYKMFFDTAAYFREMNISTFYPYVEVVFNIVNTNEHYHVPLLISPYGYSTYRGS